MPAPDWIDSPYVSFEYGHWTISKDAPQDLKDEFYAWMKDYEKLEAEGVYM